MNLWHIGKSLRLALNPFKQQDLILDNEKLREENMRLREDLRKADIRIQRIGELFGKYFG